MSFTEIRKFIESIEKYQEQPNPMDYEDSPQGDAEYSDDHWQGDIEAMLYHEDMGDR